MGLPHCKELFCKIRFLFQHLLITNKKQKRVCKIAHCHGLRQSKEKMALFFYEQWTCSLKKCHGASFGNGLKEEVEKHVFFLWINIKTFRFKESVTFEKRKIKDMVERLAVALSRGKCHWEETWAASASRLTAECDTSCSSIATKGDRRPSACSFCPCQTRGAVWGHMRDTVDCLDWDSTTVLGQCFLVAMAFQTALTRSNVALDKDSVG